MIYRKLSTIDKVTKGRNCENSHEPGCFHVATEYLHAQLSLYWLLSKMIILYFFCRFLNQHDDVIGLKKIILFITK